MGCRIGIAISLAADVSAASGPVILSADGQTPAYTRIQGVLKSSPETPDCSHPAFAPGDTASYHVALAPLRGFANDVALSVAGLPADASATFAPTSLRIATSSATPPGTYTLVISGVSGVLSHVSIVPLNVRP